MHATCAGCDPTLGEVIRMIRALDDVLVVAALQPDGLFAEDIDGRYDLDLGVEPDISMLTC
jgi:hypothetical protein